MSSAGRPVKLKTTLMMGMLMLGKMSVGVRNAEAVPKIRISTAMTTNVYGRRKASRTIPSMTFSDVKRCCCRGNGRSLEGPSGRRLAAPTRNFQFDKQESRVEFLIRKMHSLHRDMHGLNCIGVPIA